MFVENDTQRQYGDPCRGDTSTMARSCVAPTGLARFTRKLVCYKQGAPTELVPGRLWFVSTIEWHEDGWHIGRGTNHYFRARAKMEGHR